jgi:hypothetical protein
MKMADQTAARKGAELLYEMEKLQDTEQQRIATYEVEVSQLSGFIRNAGIERIEYIHE